MRRIGLMILGLSLSLAGFVPAQDRDPARMRVYVGTYTGTSPAKGIYQARL